MKPAQTITKDEFRHAFEAHVAKPPVGPLKMRISPEMAAVFLEKNQHNRRLRPGHIKELARQMEEGNFGYTGVPIVVSAAGFLMDGQNRLMAIKESKMAVFLAVQFGIEDHLFAVFDVGARRSPTDTFAVAGYDNPTSAAGAIRVLEAIRSHNGNTKNVHWTHTELLAHYDPEIQVSLKTVRGVKSLGTPLPVSWAAAVHMLAAALDRRAADAFFDKLVTGASLSKTDPVLLLRTKLFRAGRTEPMPPPREACAWTIKAWNAARVGKKTAKALTWDAAKEDFPKVHA